MILSQSISLTSRGKWPLFLEETEAFRDRVQSNGGSIESGALRDLYDPYIQKAKDLGYYSLSVHLSSSAAVEVVSGSIRTQFDASGDENDALQTTSSERPTETTSSKFDSNRVGDYDSSDDNLLVDFGSTVGDPITVIVIWFSRKVDVVNVLEEPTNYNLNAGVSDQGNHVIYQGSSIQSGGYSANTVYSTAYIFDSTDEVVVDGTSVATGDAGSGGRDTFTIGSKLRPIDGQVAFVHAFKANPSISELTDLTAIPISYYSL